MAASRPIYDHLVGPEATAAQRFEAYAYRLAGLTEFWRAYRNYAGVLYFTYLGGDPPTSITCDNFRDVQRLQFQPRFEHYVREAFKPLGVYVNFWQPSLPAGARRHFRVMMVNDTDQPAAGKLEVVWLSEAGDREAAGIRQDYKVPALGQASYDVTLATPATPGPYVLAAKAHWDGRPWSPTVARRKVTVTGQPPLPHR
jgi:hypothetical protein